MRKIFLSKNISLNMPKNMLISLKNCKNRQRLGALPPDPLVSGGWGLRFQTPTSVILRCAFFSLHMPTKAKKSFGLNQTTYFLVIIAGVHQAFGVVKSMLYFVCHNYGIYNHRFQFFSFVPPTHFALAPPLTTRRILLPFYPTLIRRQKKAVTEASASSSDETDGI